MNKFQDIIIKHFDRYHLERSKNKDFYELWPNKKVQVLRFKVLSEIDNLNNKTILDVGCGLGEFYFFCRKNKINFRKYTGIELHKEIVRQANEKFPKLSVLCMDILENRFKAKSFDYVIASGLFNVAMKDWNKRTDIIIREMYRISKRGMALNFLRYRKKNKNPASHYEKFENIIKIIEKYANSFVIRCDYKENDFTIYVYKNERLKTNK